MVDKFTIIRDLGRFFQRGFFSFPTKDLKRNQVTIPNNWKHKIRKETSQKSPFKIFCFNNGNTTKTKDLQKLFDKEIHCTLITLSINPLSLFHGQTVDTKISALVFVAKSLLIRLLSVLKSIFFICNKFVHFSFP